MNYRMPAEWKKQQSIWLTWPYERGEWPSKFESIPKLYCEIIGHIARTQQVDLLIQDQDLQDQAIRMLEQAGINLDLVNFHQIKSDRVWIRDSGPTFVEDIDGKQVLLDWQFNAWAKYDDWQMDNEIPEQIAKECGYEITQPIYKDKRIVMEGGAIDVNGAGLLLTTEECLLDQNIQVRNPGYTKEDYQDIFEQYLGIEEIIWLNRGIAGDDTHGHVDDISRFVGEYRVITAVEIDTKDENYEPLQQNKKTLEQYKTQDGRALEVIELPMPAPLYYNEQRLPASYANFLICNDIVLVPVFNDPNDQVALDIISQCFPKREAIAIHAVDLVMEFGTLHCLSQQQPILRL